MANPKGRPKGPEKKPVYLRLLATTVAKLEKKATEKGYASVPAYLADSIERQQS